MRKNFLLLTTENDISTPLFFNTQIKELFKPDVELLSKDFKPRLIDKYDLVYIRDPFTGKLNEGEIEEILLKIFSTNKKTRFIDNLTDLADVFIEDKWSQYKMFKDVMPETRLYDGAFNVENEIAKKRISSRSKGIVFTAEGIDIDSHYIVQEKINIKQEFRVYVIKDKIIDKCAVKISKSPTSKVSLSSVINLPEDLNKFTKNIIAKLNFDFIGLDIALDQDDKIYLIEINRSPQFIGFFRESGINLAKELLINYYE